MKSFQCSVERTDKYVVEFDENILNEEWMESHRRFFYDYDTLEEHAEHIAKFRARNGQGFIEGYGIPLENGKCPHWADEKQVNNAINIKIISEDSDIYVDID